jgi:hypothetical protein
LDRYLLKVVFCGVLESLGVVLEDLGGVLEGLDGVLEGLKGHSTPRTSVAHKKALYEPTLE